MLHKVMLFSIFLAGMHIGNAQVVLSPENHFKVTKTLKLMHAEDTLSPKYFIYMAESYMYDHKYEKAIQFLKRAQEYTPSQMEVYLLRCDIYDKLGIIPSYIKSYKEAIRMFEKGLVTNKKPFILYHTFAVFCLKRQMYKEAEEYFTKALMYRSSAFAYYNRGIARLHLEKSDLACADLLRAKELDVDAAIKTVDVYCKDYKVNQLLVPKPDYSEETINYYALGRDTIYARIYFEKDWEISDDFEVRYRECNWVISSSQFDGKFIDYLGKNRYAEGKYQNGLKNGVYRKYYREGVTECIGNFKDDEPFGVWRYYYPNQQLKMMAIYDGNNFDIESFYDENGKALLEDGNGRWEHSFVNGRDYTYTIKGQYKDYKRDGRWTMECDPCMQSVAETYDEGIYKKTYTNLWDHSEKEQKIFFNSWIMMELRHHTIKNLSYSSLEIFNAYSFFDNIDSMTKTIIEF